MTLPQLLFLMRLVSGALLLLLLGFIAYYLYRDALAVGLRADVGRHMAALRVVASKTSEPAADTRFPLGMTCSIGRSSQNHIVLDDSYVSQEHARIVRRDGHWWLEDLGSRNGTLLNDIPLAAETVITPGDLITIGQVTFKLEPAK